GWDPEIDIVTGNVTYTAQFSSTVKQYTITFVNEDGTELQSIKVAYGETPAYTGETPTKAADAQYTYTHSGWTPAIKVVDGEATYTATYTETLRSYTVTWKNEDGTELEKDENVPYNTVPTYNGETPTKAGGAQYSYTWNGWTPAVSAVTGDVTYTATYTATVNTYTVTWVNWNGDVLETDENVPYGTTPTYDKETNPTKEGDAQYSYTFKGWTPEVSGITGNTEYTATFEQVTNTYTVTWVDENGTTLDEQVLPYDAIPVYGGETPSKETTAEHTFTFNGWKDVAKNVNYTNGAQLPAVSSDVTYKVLFQQTTNQYLIIWVNEDGTELSRETVSYGNTPTYKGNVPVKDPDAQYTYTHSGWIPEVSSVTGEATYKATYSTTINKYTVTWKNENGDVLETDENVPYGTQPSYDGETPTKAGDAQYSYTFKEWIDENDNVYGSETIVEGDIIYTATFTQTVNKYTVTWADEDGNELEKDENVPYGTTPSYDGETPTKAATTQHTYTFTGWSPEINTVTGDVTYTAQFSSTVNKYKVTFVDENGTVLKEATEYDYGTPAKDIVKPEDPTKGATAQYTYTFAGWTPAVSEVTGDATYTATYSSAVNEYTITFKNEDGTVLQSGKVAFGDTPAYTAATPTKPATAQYTYTFAGWDKEIVSVTGEAIYTATFTQTVNKYTVTWADEDGTELEKDENVEYGTTPSYDGETPTKASTNTHTYEFKEWAPAVSEVKGDVTYKASYTESVRYYTITFENYDGTELKSYSLPYGDPVSYDGETPLKEGNVQHSYTFKGWDADISNVTGDATYTAVFNEIVNEYTITWVDGDGETLKTEQVAYGETPVYSGETPTKAETQQYYYEFNNTWSPEIVSVTGDAEYTAQFSSTVKKYSVVFVDEDGTVLKEATEYDYGTPANNIVKPEDPTKGATAQYTYTFAGWTPALSVVSDHVVYKATYSSTVNKYTIKFVDENGTTVLQSSEVAYGELPAYTGETPTKAADDQYTYTFAGWTPTVSEVTGEATYTATYTATVNEYTIEFLSEDGNDVLQSGKVAYGETPVYSGNAPTKAGYTFKGWADSKGGSAVEIPTVKGDATYYAVFEINKYTVTWLKENGETVATETVEHGKDATKTPAVPEKFGHTGVWEPASVTNVTADVEVKPVYTPITYKVYYYINNTDTEAYKTFDVVFGTAYTIPENPFIEGKTFKQWIDANNNALTEGKIHNIAEDAKFYANCDDIFYVVRWIADGKEVFSVSVKHGTDVTENIPAVPEKTGHTGTWENKSVTSIESNLDINAIYTVNKYEVTFTVNGVAYGEPIKVDYGAAVTAPEFTPNEGYDFSGWDVPETMPAEDITLDATHTIKTFTVTWNVNGVETAETYDYGEPPVYPNGTPTKDADAQYTYTFAGWDPVIDIVTGNVTYTAQFSSTVNKYTIKFVNEDGNTVLQSSEVAYGELPVYTAATPTKTATAQYTYTFAGWDKEFSEVTGEATYTATYTATINKYLIKFVDEDGTTILQSGEVEYDTLPEYKGSTPTKARTDKFTYTFAGWDKEFSKVTGEETYTATYTATVNKYLIKFVDEDGITVLWSGEVEYDTLPEYKGSTPTKAKTDEYTYTFDGWDKEIASVTGEATYTAKYKAEKNSYTITWRNDDGSYLGETTVLYGETPTAPVTPQKVATAQYTYTFANWSPELVPVTGNATYTATYTSTVNKYTVTWVIDGKETTETYEYGATPVHEDPSKDQDAQYTYSFTAWRPAVVSVTGDATYTAEFASTVRSYEIKFVDWDDREISKTTVEYGNMPSAPANPTRDGGAQFTYTFAGWTPEIKAVESEATYKATYTETVNKYTVTFVDWNGTELYSSEVEFGKLPSYKGETPARAGNAQFTYTFRGWDNGTDGEADDLEAVSGNVTYKALYNASVNKYKVTWVDEDGTELAVKENVSYGTTPNYEGELPTKAPTAQYTYTFDKWTPAEPVTGDTVYKATYTATVNKYTVTWENWDGTELEKDENVEYGETPKYNGAEPKKNATAQNTYTFAGWTPAVSTVTGDVTYTAQFDSAVNEYTITFKNEDGTVLQSSEVAYGELPAYTGETPTKAADAQYTYTFEGWSPVIVDVTGNATYTATYTATVNKYTIKFVNEDGTTVLQSSEVAFGETPAYTGETPTKAATEQYTYTFKGWTPAIKAVDGEATYTAKFDSTVNKYTVIWQNEDGTVLETDENVAYGTMPEYNGVTPKKNATAQYTYTFDKWDKEVVSVTGDVIYKATYSATVNKYIIVFENEDGTELQSSEVAYGETPAYTGETPTKAADAQYTYTFEGWSPVIVDVTGKATYTATYTATVNEYTIIFENEDGTELQSKKVAYGEIPAYTGETPTKAADVQYTYTFKGWTPVIASVTGDAIYTATYSTTVNEYTVTFENEDGTELQSGKVAYGATPKYNGETPTKAADDQYTYTFKGWTPAIVSVTGDATYTAAYSTTVNKYTVTWKNGNSVLETDENVPYGTTPEYNGETPTKAATAEFTYTFKGWTPAVSEVTGNITYNAEFTATVNEYTITFKNEDGTVLDEQTVKYGDTPVYGGETPEKAATAQYTYTFDKWDKKVVSVTGDATYTATYSSTVNEYTITFVNEDGTELQSGKVAYGATPKYNGETPTKAADAQYTYTHSGWTPAIVSVTGDATYTATYKETLRSYTVIWQNEDGTVLETDENVAYGTIPAYNSGTPTKAGNAQYSYTWNNGWTPAVSAVTGDVTYTATFTESVNEYTIRFVDWDNKELQSGKVPYGTVPTAPSDPFRAATAQYTYTFEGWDKEIVSVTGEATYKATYTETVNKYTVKFVDENGTTILDEQTLAYGETPDYGKEDPVKEGHTFKGWDKTFASVTGDVTYTAVYEINRYSVTWQDEDGTVIEPDKNVAWGTTPVYNSLNPTKTGHTFIGWKDEDGNFYDSASSIVTGDIVYTAVYEINRYTVTWTDENGNEIEKDENVPYGTVPTFDKEIPEKAATAQYTYTFRGWRNVKTTEETEAGKDLPMVTDNVTYRILYHATVNKYTVTWVNEDGKELYKEEEVSYGITPTYKGETPTKEATAQYTFTHSGWTPEVSSVTGDITYTATYSSKVNTYSVTWMNGGSVAEFDAAVPYGATPEYNGKVPAKPATAEFTYTFKGWTPAVSEVTGNITYNAEFTATVNEYTVKFVDENGTTLDEQVLPYGETPVYGGKTPEKAATAQYTYTFEGWDKEISKVTGNATYRATYSSVVNKYTVTWVGENDEIVETESVEYGSNASKKPAVPAKEGYTGRWEGDTNGITKDVTIKAVYQINSYKATFTINGEKYTEFNFVYGSKVTIPEYKVPEGHTFGGWNNVPETMPAKDITLDAVLTANVYKMTYTINGEVYKEFDVTYGTEVPVPEYEIPEGHTFTEWKDIPETMPAKDVVIDTTLTVNIYKVTYTKNGEFHADYEIAYGDPVYVPGYTVPEGYTFSGWTVPDKMPAKDLVIDATETPNVYKVSFTINGEAYGETIEVTYGTKITVPEYNVPEGHTFGGWTVPDKMPAGDRTYDAVLTKNVYTVTFNLDGELYYEEQVTYGEPVTAPVYEGKDGYTFSGWNVPETMPAENIVLDATETINSYVLTFTINGEIYQQSEVEYRSRIRVPSYTVPEGHTFSGWNVPPRATMPARDMTVDATLTVNTYTVTFTVNGEVYKEVEVTYGTEITAPEYEVPKGYVFSGWTEIPEKMPAEDITLDAELILNEFTVIFTVNGEKYSEISVVVGGVINAPEYEVPEGHTFGGWTVPEVMPAEDITLDAALTPNKYTVTFTVNGEAYGEAVEVTYGTAITVPEYEAPEGHTFGGWTVPETMPAENITLDAALTVNKYEITWVVDGEEIKTEVEFGKLPEFEGTPEKEADENFTYTFKEWDKEIVEVTGTATYTAVFTRTGWETSEDGKHYLVEDEIQKTGWTEIDGNWYYLDTESGVPATGNAYLPYNTELGYGPNDFDESYVPEEDEEEYPDSEKSWFVFDENGVFQSGLTGFHTLNGETVWAVNGELPFNVGLVSAGGEYYYFCAGRTMVTGDYHITRTNGIIFDNGAAAVEKGVYTFGADGKLIRYDGITEIDGTLYHYDRYRKNVGAGLIMIDGNFYYVRTSGALVVNTKYWVEKVNEFDYISVGSYEFDENGVMQITVTEKSGVYAEEGAYYYYENGVRTYKGLIRYSDGKNYNNDIIYVTSSGMLATGNYYVAADNGLIEPGYFLFDEFGRLTRNGIYEEDGVLHYYRNGEIQYGTGLIIYKGDYYYVRSNGALAVGNYWITNNNGLMECGMYYFDENGKLIGAPIEEEPEELKNGFYEENGGIFYYVNGKIQYSAGLVLIGGEYYYIRSNGQVAIGEYWITNTNGLMPMDKYYFDSLGRMTEGPEVPVVPEDPDNTKNGFYEENGGIFYYLNGDIQYGAGLIKVDDEYYYVRSNGQAATGRYWVTNNNGILPQGMYEFAEDGKMITE
ncbi:MAG: InlB B-repeat-containing protein, partial [Oscillospiraceae bacterium]|nr:InlB B-repeat-containing protein [Oscillospiraceae bacterium]